MANWGVSGVSTDMGHGVRESLPEFLVKPIVKSVAVFGKVKHSESQRLSHCSPLFSLRLQKVIIVKVIIFL